MLYDVICSLYAPNVPFTAASLRGSGYSAQYVRRQLCALVKAQKLARYCTGVYYRPDEGPLGPLLAPVFNDVLALLYTKDAGGAPCGFLGGYFFANRLGLTTQVPMVYEVYTNRASCTRRRLLGKSGIILRKPPVPVTAENLNAVRLLTLITDIDTVAETDMNTSGEIIRCHMERNQISAASLTKYLDAFPAKTAENLVRLGVLRPQDAL